MYLTTKTNDLICRASSVVQGSMVVAAVKVVAVVRKGKENS
jgi:hypothetical protein